MRGNTDAEVAAYVQRLASFRTSTPAYFQYGGGTHPIDPELVILGGDISEDRGTSVGADLPLWQPLYDAGIAFIAGFGNHDWDPEFWSDGPGYSLAGHLSNESTTGFTVRPTGARRSSPATSPTGRWRPRPHGPVTFHSAYKGVEIINFNTFLYQPSYSYPEGSRCRPTCAGRSGLSTLRLGRAADRPDHQPVHTRADRTALFVQHYPLSTTDNWWSDYDASGTTVTQKKNRLLGLMSQFDHPALLAGHSHVASQRSRQFPGRTFKEYVAPYFGGNDLDDLTRGGGFLALLVSPTDGVLEVVTVPDGI